MRNEWADRPHLWRLLSGKETDWNAVIDRLVLRPDEARWQRTQHGRSGRLFLHYVLEHHSPPLDVVEKLIEVYPGALQHQNCYGSLPLHEAVNMEHGNSVDVVRAVFQAYPEALSQKNVPGCSPIHYVLNWGPFANSQSRARKLLSDRNVNIVRVLLQKNHLGEEEEDTWIEHISTSSLVIAVKELDAPWHLVCTLWNRDDIVECDTNLQLLTRMLLHARYTARHFHNSSTSYLPSYQALHAMLQEENKPFRQKKFREYFIKRYGYQASERDFKGRLCLSYAIELGYTWNYGLKLLYDLAIKALETRDEVTHLYPFMTAAVGENADLTTVMELLRQTPSVVANVLIKSETSLHGLGDKNRPNKRRKRV